MVSNTQHAATGASVHPLPGAASPTPQEVDDATLVRNPGMPLDLGVLEAMRAVNRSALERRVATLSKRRSIKGDNQAAWLLRSISVMDLTTLNSDDTPERMPFRACGTGRALHNPAGFGYAMRLCLRHHTPWPEHLVCQARRVMNSLAGMAQI